jgi:alginate O-acetyltransferase complex protein AlgI
MSFISTSFVVFYLIVLTFRISVGRDKQSQFYLRGLLAFSLLFYGWHVPHYLLIILTCILTNFIAGCFLYRFQANQKTYRRLTVIITVMINTGVLAYFKYADFLTSLVQEWLGETYLLNPTFNTIDIILPIGISFYTFQSLSYTLDVHKGRIPAEHHLTRFALFISFFPQLIAGPIVRANQFFYQIPRKRRVCWPVFLHGGYLILRGLFWKLVIADNIGNVVDRYWNTAAQPDAPSTLALSMLVLFSCQIFCDFVAYTDIARGIAYQLGFRLPINFNMPFIARTFREFWRRWHITLSHWIRDYLYLPLGGNQRGQILTIRNLLIVFLLSGLWHGAGLNFVMWGALHGVCIAIEHGTGLAGWIERKRAQSTLLSFIPVFSWFLLVQFTWILSMAFFRAADSNEALQILQNVITAIPALFETGLSYPKSNGLIIVAWWFTVPVWVMHARAYLQEQLELTVTIYERSVYAGIMLYSVLTVYSSNSTFIYFQF